MSGLVGLLIGLAVGAGSTIAVQNADRDRAEGPSPPAGTSPGGPDAESVSVFDLETGDCILQLNVGVASSVDLVDCDEPHDAEVVGVVELEDGRNAPYPGDEETIDRIDALCRDVFEAYVGISIRESELTADAMYPVEESWRFGDREGVCYAYHEEPLTESIEGSAR